MRSVLFACAAMWLLMSAPRVDASTMAASSAPTISAPSAVFAVQVPDKKIEVTVDQQRSGGGAWYRSPVWVAIGVLAFIVLVMLIVLLTRSGGGGGTTIVRD